MFAKSTTKFAPAAAQSIQLGNTVPTFKKTSKLEPFGAHFATKLDGVNSKLVCALSAVASHCTDDSGW